MQVILSWYNHSMKAFIVFVLVLGLLGVGGFFGYKYLARPTAEPTTTEAQTVTLEGKLMSGKGDDYSYILLDGNGKTVGVASQTIELGQYMNKMVAITGTFSGSTLYAYTVTEK